MLVGIDEFPILKIDKISCTKISDIADASIINRYFSNFLSKNIVSNL